MKANRKTRFSEMSLTALRKYAKDVHGLLGLSKAPREKVQAAINVARQPKPMEPDRRVEIYSRGRSVFTARQDRRIRKHERKLRG